jgi:hypothetical protein
MIAGELTSTQKGKVTEALVTCTLMLASGGRLSPFLPISDDQGIDLIVLDKTTQRSIAIQVKYAIANPARGTVQFDVRKATHNEAADRYLIAVLFDPLKVALTTSWLIPMSSLSEVSVQQAGKYALSPSTSPNANDRYRYCRNESPQRCE